MEKQKSASKFIKQKQKKKKQNAIKCELISSF